MLSEAEDEEWGEDEEIVSTSRTEAVVEAIPFTRKEVEPGLKLVFNSIGHHNIFWVIKPKLQKVVADYT